MVNSGQCLTCTQLTDSGFGIASADPSDIVQFYADHFPQLGQAELLQVAAWVATLGPANPLLQIAQRLCQECADRAGLTVGYLPIPAEGLTEAFLTLPSYQLG